MSQYFSIRVCIARTKDERRTTNQRHLSFVFRPSSSVLRHRAKNVSIKGIEYDHI
jgi:hypothetical protein